MINPSIFTKICISGLSLFAVAAFPMATEPVFAGETPITVQALDVIQPTPPTQSSPRDNRAPDEKTAHNPSAGSLSPSERAEIAVMASATPSIQLDIQFDDDSADISASSIPSVQALGEAMTGPLLKGSVFMIAGYADAVGTNTDNQILSKRRADSIKRYLVDNFRIAEIDLIAVGYGDARLKSFNMSTNARNRRVEVIRMLSKPAGE
jgi:outer membrane protein OmpA-like peptidoglycan-associated protein